MPPRANRNRFSCVGQVGWAGVTSTTGAPLNRYLPILIAIIAMAGCTHHHAKIDTSKCPEAKPLSPLGWKLGVGDYEAQIVQDVLVVQAHGENPGVNYDNQVALLMPDVFPPKFALYMRKSPNAGAHALTDFKVCAKYRLSPSQHLDFVVVRDANGDHVVKMELTSK